MDSKHFLHYWLPVIAWGAVIVSVSAAPARLVEPAARISPDISVLAHFGEFLVFSILLSRALAAREKLSAPALLAATLFIGFVFSALVEMLQLYVPGRFFSYGDIFTNNAGILLGTSTNIFFNTKLYGDEHGNARQIRP